MLNEKDAIKIVIDLVPNWYLAEFGPKKLEIELRNVSVEFFSHRPLTPSLKSLLNEINLSLPKLYELTKDLPKLTATEIIQEHFALFWLAEKNKDIQWKDYLEYADTISLRTYENQNVTFNFVISKGSGSMEVKNSKVQKFLDSLATSPFTFIRTNHELKFIDFEEIKWSDVKDTEEYKFNPEFLQPIKSMLKKEEFSIHLTNRSDIIIMNYLGLLAAKRKKRWKLYDVKTFKNFIVDIVGDYRVGTNIFEVLWDLSFKRHGALLIYDPNKIVVRNVVNKGSVMFDGSDETLDEARKMLMPSIKEKIIMAHPHFAKRKKRLFLEIASMDGAVIFSNALILAFGAMIKTHEKADKESGARSTAARSAFYWGGHPIKISSDGEITLYFTSKSGENECNATTEFL